MVHLSYKTIIEIIEITMIPIIQITSLIFYNNSIRYVSLPSFHRFKKTDFGVSYNAFIHSWNK